MNFKLITIDPLTRKRFKRFHQMKRGYYSFVLLTILLILSCFAELLVSNRALLVYYNGTIRLPTYSNMIPGREFGLDYDYETNYRDLQNHFKEQHSPNVVIMPLIPWNEYETDLPEGLYPPFPPSLERKHLLGTDMIGRDVFARLVYGFRTAIFFALILLVVNYLVGITVGSLMGYFGGWFDLLVQRLIEIWTNVPFIYVIIILSSIMVPTFFMLIAIMIFFGWTAMTWYMRTVTYKEKMQEYALASQALGASTARTLLVHILPNAVSVIVTFIPFSVAGGIVALTSLDYLGFGLPPPTPSWGELLKQGTANLDAIWIVASVTVTMVMILSMITFIGEAIREAFDPKRHTLYE